jgi:uncharacterized protein YcbX
MADRIIGSVGALFRFPVKSMLGQRVAEFAIGPNGVFGDRAWALRELATGRIVSAKKWAEMFRFRASYPTPPERNPAHAAIVTTPEGRDISADDPAASAAISDALGHKVRIERAEANKVSRALFDPALVFGDTPLEQVLPSLIKYLADQEPPGPDDFAMPRGTFFDAAPLHLITRTTLDRMAALSGLDAFDVQRFRPNILIDNDDAGSGFIEDEWLGRRLAIGSAVTVEITIPVIRCVMTTHAQGDLPRELGVLRAVAAHHGALAGVYAKPIEFGIVRTDDPVRLLEQSN